MGKSLDDLHLSDAPLARLAPVDVRDTDWYRFCVEIDDLILSDDYVWALDTLEGIRASVEKFRTVTPGQRRAIENIRAARRRSGGHGGSRRYEGFRRD